MFINLTDRNCPLCHSEKSDYMFTWKDYRYQSVENDFSYHSCSNCDHIFLKSYPAQNDVVKLYPPNLMNYGDIESSNSIGYKIKNLLDLRGIKKIVADNGIKKISALDIGCGTGLYLDQLKHLSPAVEVDCLEGMEISGHASEVARNKGYTIHQCLLEDFTPAKKYNIIIMQQVVEHLYDLDKSFNILFNMLADDGILIIETPHLNCFDRTLFKKYWEGYHIPRHFNLFKREGFNNWLNKFGLTVHSYELKIKPVHWIYSIQNMMLDKGTKYNWLSPFFTYKNTFLLLLFAPIDLFQMIVFRKSSDIRYIVKKIAK